MQNFLEIKVKESEFPGNIVSLIPTSFIKILCSSLRGHRDRLTDGSKILYPHNFFAWGKNRVQC